MTPPKLSRRDWFRLRSPHQNQLLSDSNPESPSLLQPIEQPPNHDGLDLSKLPPMREAILSAEQVAALFSDIKHLAEDIVLMQRASSPTQARVSRAESLDGLEAAQSMLLDGTIQRVQVRYRWQDSLWIDTLKRVDDGFHVVRIQHPT